MLLSIHLSDHNYDLPRSAAAAATAAAAAESAETATAAAAKSAESAAEAAAARRSRRRTGPRRCSSRSTPPPPQCRRPRLRKAPAIMLIRMKRMTMTPMKFRPRAGSVRRDVRMRGAPECVTLRPLGDAPDDARHRGAESAP